MDKETKYRIWQAVGVSTVSILLIVALSWGHRQTPSSVPCEEVVYFFSDASQRMYVSEEELNTLLEKEQLYPVGKSIGSVALYRMEQLFSEHSMIRSAECYLTPRHTVQVDLSQRIPLLRVERDEETYFVDTDRKRMPYRPAVTDSVPVIKGAVTEEMACAELAGYAKWLQGNRYWRERVSHLDVRSPKMIHLYLKGAGQPRIILGEIDGYKAKLAKLRTYFEEGAAVTQDKEYTELDLRFKDQVIGRK